MVPKLVKSDKLYLLTLNIARFECVRRFCVSVCLPAHADLVPFAKQAPVLIPHRDFSFHPFR
jgi:hypothetical protein